MSASDVASSPLQPWHEIVRQALKAHQVRLVTYVPDKVLAPLIRSLHADDYFTVICPPTRWHLW